MIIPFIASLAHNFDDIFPLQPSRGGELNNIHSYISETWWIIFWDLWWINHKSHLIFENNITT